MAQMETTASISTWAGVEEEVQVSDRQYGFERIVGSSAALQDALDIAARVSSTDATVVIFGETGTGKELVAQAIHVRSKRCRHPFVTINCGAIPREILESELFGHVRGSFTGAFAHKKGKVEIADAGTVFLDEIGEMPLDLQVRILRLIQEREIEKVGSTAHIKVDVRIIAATHRNLADMVDEGTFRADLYYRLMVVPVTLPPLRARPGDIPKLVHYFFDKCRTKHKRPDLTLGPEVMPYFTAYHWPGNVRQLENAIERTVLLGRGDEVTAEDLADFLRVEVGEMAQCGCGDGALPAEEIGLAGLEKQTILQALRKSGGNQTRAAQQLKISRRVLGCRLEKYGVTGAFVRSMRPVRE
jgi:transcriptional regulator with PAS, ATPase and Fis domain